MKCKSDHPHILILKTLRPRRQRCKKLTNKEKRPVLSNVFGLFSFFLVYPLSLSKTLVNIGYAGIGS